MSGVVRCALLLLLISILSFVETAPVIAAEKGGCICFLGNEGETGACIDNATSVSCDSEENKLQEEGGALTGKVGATIENTKKLKNCYFFATSSGSCDNFANVVKKKNDPGTCTCQIAGKSVEKNTGVTMLQCAQLEYNLKQNNKNSALDCAFGDDTTLNIAGVSSGGSASAHTEEMFTPAPFPPPRLNIPIPNLPQFSEIPPPQTAGGDIVVPWLGQYFAAAYQYFVGVGVIIAIILIMIGGIQWLTAGGSAERLGSAKKRIGNAVAGLSIALGSYLILYTINPDIIQFKGLVIPSVKREGLEFDYEQHTDNSSEAKHKPNGFDPGGQNDVAFQECMQAKPSQKFIGSYIASRISYAHLDTISCGSKGTRALKAKNGRDGVTHVVLHEGGNTAGIVNYWNSQCQKTGKCYGTHFSIEPNGTIYQLEGIEGYVGHGGKTNSYSIGIDLNLGIGSGTTSDKCIKNNAGLGKAGAIDKCTPKYTSAMLDSIAALVKDLVLYTEIKIQPDRILAHCMWAHADPRGFPWEELGKRLGISISSETQGEVSQYAKLACAFGDKYTKRLEKWADMFKLN